MLWSLKAGLRLRQPMKLQGRAPGGQSAGATQPGSSASLALASLKHTTLLGSGQGQGKGPRLAFQSAVRLAVMEM